MPAERGNVPQYRIVREGIHAFKGRNKRSHGHAAAQGFSQHQDVGQDPGMFKSKELSADAFEKAEALLDELRAESPLRHRLSLELEEIRKLHTAKV